MVSRHAEQHARLGARVVDLPQDLVPRAKDAVVDLVGRGDRIRRVATEEKDVATRKDQRRAAVVDRVLGEQHPSDGLAHIVVVARVRDPVDPEGRSMDATRVALFCTPRTCVTAASISAADKGRIQSRESTDSLAMALAMRFLKCPSSEVAPYQRMA